MAEFQKFMFDNFVISGGEKPLEEENVVSEIENSVETAVSEGGEEFLDASEITITESEQEVNDEIPVSVEPEVSYSQDQLDEEVKRAEENGYEKGVLAASTEHEALTRELLLKINENLQALLSEAKERAIVLEEEYLRMSVEIVKHILPTLEASQAQAAVKRFLQDNFANFCSEERLSFSFNPSMVRPASEIISKLAAQNDFEGKIAIHKDESLSPADCRVEWLNGGVERNSDKMLEKVDKLLNDKPIR